MERVQNYTHILNIDIDNNLCNHNKNEIALLIYNIIHNKVINKNILNTDIPIKWIIVNESNLFTYYTDVKGMLGDKAIYLHTEMLLDDIRHEMNIHYIYFNVTKPLMQQLCML